MLKKDYEKQSENPSAGTVLEGRRGRKELMLIDQMVFRFSVFPTSNNGTKGSISKAFTSLFFYRRSFKHTPKSWTNKGKTQKKSLQSDLNTPSKIVHKLCTVCVQGWVMDKEELLTECRSHIMPCQIRNLSRFLGLF